MITIFYKYIFEGNNPTIKYVVNRGDITYHRHYVLNEVYYVNTFERFHKVFV